MQLNRLGHIDFIVWTLDRNNCESTFGDIV